MGIQERKALEKQMRRNQILDAARKLLFSKGMANISIAGIAEESQLGVGTIYFYYKRKEDIFVALQEEGLALLYSIIQQIRAREDIVPEEKILRIARAYFDFSLNQVEYFDIINYFLSSPKMFFNETQKERIDMSGNRILAIIIEVIQEGIERGEFTAPDPMKFAVMFWGTLHGLVQFRKLESTILKNEDLGQIHDFSVAALIRTIKPDHGGEDKNGIAER